MLEDKKLEKTIHFKYLDKVFTMVGKSKNEHIIPYNKY